MSLYTDNYVTRAVAGAATPAHGTPRTHAVGITTGRVVCGTVKPEHILQDNAATPAHVLPTCPVCLRALSLVLAAPRSMRQQVADGDAELRAAYAAAEKRQCRLTAPHAPHLYGDGLACPGIAGAK